MSTRLCTSTNRVHKILTLQAQRLDPIDVRNRNCTIAIGDNWISMNVCSLIIDLNHLSRVCIVINHHTSITNNSNATNLARMEPTDMDMRCHPISKFQVQMSNITNVRKEMGTSL